MAVYENIGERLPIIEGHDLERKDVKLPDSAQGHVTLVVLVSKRQAQEIVDSWISAFEERLCRKKGYMYYEVPLISGAWGRFFSGTIDGGMRAGIPKEKHHNVVTFYGDYGKIYENLKIVDRDSAHAILIDKMGTIRWRGEGTPTGDDIEELIDTAMRLEQE